MLDVVIVGAGCVGSYLASLLSKEGLTVTVIEKDINVADSVNCSGIIGLDSFQSFDLPQDIIQSEMKDITVYSPSGCKIHYSPKKTLAYVVDRSRLDRKLFQNATDEGVSYKMSCSVENICVHSSGVKLDINTRGKKEVIKSKICVLASGFGSKIVEKAGMGRIDNYVQGAQVEAELSGVENTQIFLGRKVAPNFFAWVAPSGENKCKVGLVSNEKSGSYLKRFLENDFFGKDLNLTSPMKVSLLPMTALQKTFSDRLIVVGEAAGQIKPTTFGGIYYGFLCAKIASNTIKKSFEMNKFDESILSEYEKKWKEKISSEQAMGMKFLQVFSKMSDNHIDSIINLANRNGLVSLVDRFFDFDFHSHIIKNLLSNPYKIWFDRKNSF